MMPVKGHEPDEIPALQELSVCQQNAQALWFHDDNDLLPEIEPFSSKDPQRLGYGSNNEHKASFATHTLIC